MVQNTRLGSALVEGMKTPVVVATTLNIALQGLPLISGVQLVACDRVLVKSQNNKAENGIYVVASGTWDRAKDFNASNDVVNGQLVIDSNSGLLYRVNFTGEIDLGVTLLSFFVAEPDSRSKQVDTLADWQNDLTAQLRDVVTTAERSTGNGGGATGDVIASGTEDGFSIVKHNTLPLSFELRADKLVSLDSLVDDPSVNADAAVAAWLQHPQKNKPVIGDFLITNIDETVSDINIYGGGTITSTGGSNNVFQITGDDNTIQHISILSQLNQKDHLGLLNIVGNGNTISHNIINHATFLPVTVEGQQNGSAGISFSGDDNEASYNVINNVNRGVQDFGYRNTIDSNTITVACAGVMITNESRHTKVINNFIDCAYAGQGLGGCDGIFGNRNHRFSTITGNTILRAGEHGTYLQGDSYTVSNNLVALSHSSGIKCGAKITEAFWYPGEDPVLLAPNSGYTGFNVVISDNVCYGGQVSGGNTGEIYIQPNMLGIIISNNIVRDTTGFGIRTVFFGGGVEDDVMEDITITGNMVTNCTEGSISTASSKNLIVEGNSCDGSVSVLSSAFTLTESSKIAGNICAGISVNGQASCVVSDNIGTFLFTNSFNTVLLSNKFSTQELGDFNSRVSEMRNNTFNYVGNVTADIQSCNDIRGNIFNMPDALGSYVVNVDFNSSTPVDGTFSDNTIIAPLASRVVRVGGSGSTINGNIMKGSGILDRVLTLFCSDCVVSGNIVPALGQIRFESGADNNVVTGNGAQINDGGAGNILGTNRP